MKKRGYHHLLLPDGREVHHVVVVFTDEDTPLSWHPLCGEEPFVEWLGGIYKWIDKK